MKCASLYICYYDVTEPLVETQVIAYLRELAQRGIEIHLLTFERRVHTVEQRQAITERLASEGITWHSLRYHQRPSLPATLYDIAIGAVKAWRICRRNNIRLVHARSHVPAAMAYVLKRVCGYKFLFDFRGMLAEEYVDGGHWREGELKFRLTKRMERAFFRRADAFVMLTERIKRDMLRDEPALVDRAEEIQVIPCCVETSRFAVSQNARRAYRAKRGWTERLVLTYVGKLGLWYLMDEMARFFAAAHALDRRFFFQVLTQSDSELMRAALEKYGVPRDSYDLSFAAPEQLSEILMASDAGLSLIRACNSKRASSPTKIGEYLAAGLPIVVNTGVGDCDLMMKEHHLGVLLSDFSSNDCHRAARELLELLDQPEVAHKCRAYAEQSLSLKQVGGPRYAAIYERLFCRRDITVSLNKAEIA